MPFLQNKEAKLFDWQKRSRIVYSAILFFASLALAADPPPPTPVPPPSLSEVLGEQLPFKKYIAAYTALQFESNASLIIGSNEDPQSFEGHTLIKRNEKGDFLLLREPLMGSPHLELRMINSKTYIRRKSGGEFSRVRYQKEFDRLLNNSMVEIFSLYKQAGFGEVSGGTVKEASLCYQKREGTICVDPATGLPLKGNLTVNRKDKAPIKVEFKVDMYAANVITIPSP
jgi:hypothetical protein